MAKYEVIAEEIPEAKCKMLEGDLSRSLLPRPAKRSSRSFSRSRKDLCFALAQKRSSTKQENNENPVSQHHFVMSELYRNAVEWRYRLCCCTNSFQFSVGFDTSDTSIRMEKCTRTPTAKEYLLPKQVSHLFEPVKSSQIVHLTLPRDQHNQASASPELGEKGDWSAPKQ